jgi:cytochrome c-type biogenesis protein CcmF
MGSWWAYYELGWGGWWFWDPVENASFMPWLVATALLHSAIVVEKRNALKIWTVLLSILAFSLSLMGAFLVRSGVLTSVHAFAVDPDRGLFILLILCFFVGGSLALFAWRAPAMKAGGLFAPVSREGSLVLNNLLLCVSCLAVFVGTLYPLALETISGEKISVGPPYFNLTFGPIILPLLLWFRSGHSLPGSAAISDGDAPAVDFARRCRGRGLWWCWPSTSAGRGLHPVGMAVAAWLVLGALTDLASRIALFKAPLATSWHRLVGLPRSAIGGILAHAGVGIMTRGHHRDLAVEGRGHRGAEARRGGEVGGYSVTFIGETPLTGPNFTGRAGRFLREGR